MITRARKPLPSWPLLLVGLPACAAIWSGWVSVGALTGFGLVHPLPGIFPGLRFNTQITLPIGVEAYASYALAAWLGHWDVPTEARRFAKFSAIGALVLGALGQIAYHLMAEAGIARAPWPVTVLVSVMPVIVVGFGAALTHLLRGGHGIAEPARPARKTAPAVPVNTSVASTAGAPKAPVPVSVTTAPTGTAEPVPVPETAKPAGTAPRFRSMDELVADARVINAQWNADNGRDISADNLVPLLKVSKGRACEVLRQLKNDSENEIQEAVR